MRLAAHQRKEGAEASPQARLTRRWPIWLAWLAVGAVIACVAGAVMAILLQQPVSDLEQTVALVRRLKVVGVVLQALAALALVACWRRIAVWIAAKGWIAPQDIAVLVASRWKLAALLAAYLLLVAIGPGELVRLAVALS